MGAYGATPAEQLRSRLGDLRTRGLAFQDAWEVAWDEVEWPKVGDERGSWQGALRGTRRSWHAAYERKSSGADAVAQLEGLGTPLRA